MILKICVVSDNFCLICQKYGATTRLWLTLIHQLATVQRLAWHMKQGAASIATGNTIDLEASRSRVRLIKRGLLLPLAVLVRDSILKLKVLNK